MIMITGKFMVIPSKRGEFLEFARELVAKERQSPGCLLFAIYEDVSIGNLFLMLEQWVDGDLLEEHAISPEFDAYETKLLSFVDGDPSWDEYEFDI
ncbi:MAG: antibiotic biosynthesis monooxygenase [Anaerolineae bacterium]|nr:antibiotic biosynthesis monooxygenase [Anaerolineae bacterium]